MLELVLPICGTVIVTVVSASLSYYLTRKAKTEMEWRQRKFEHYKELLSALSDLAVDGTDKTKANERLSSAVNTIALVASQSVVSALMEFHNEVKFSNPTPSPERHDELLRKLLLAVRVDLGVSPGDHKRSFNFHLIGSSPKIGTS